MEHYRKRLSHYKSALSGKPTTPELQMAWLMKRGYALPLIIQAWREVAHFMKNGYTFKDATEIDHKLLRLCEARRQSLNKLKVTKITPSFMQRWIKRLKIWQ